MSAPTPEEHRVRFATAVTATDALVKAIEAEQAARVGVPPGTPMLPPLPAELDALADPLGPVRDWLCDPTHPREGA